MYYTKLERSLDMSNLELFRQDQGNIYVGLIMHVERWKKSARATTLKYMHKIKTSFLGNQIILKLSTVSLCGLRANKSRNWYSFVLFFVHSIVKYLLGGN